MVYVGMHEVSSDHSRTINHCYLNYLEYNSKVVVNAREARFSAY